MDTEALFHWAFHMLSVLIIATLTAAFYKFCKDSLTTLWVRRVYDFLYPLMRRNKGYAIFIDIDNFKLVNETRGHDAGDKVLRSVGRIVRESSKLSFRYGGDELCILHLSSDQLAAIKLAESIRRRVESWQCHKNPDLRVTVTISVASYEEHARNSIKISKDRGKNCVVVLDKNGQFKPVS